MGNNKLRQQVAAIFKERGYGRLYGGGNKHNAWRRLRSSHLRRFLHLLQFKEGDVVNDGGFNHRIVKIPPPRKTWSGLRGGWVREEMRQFEYERGLLSCGCGWHPEPAKTPEQIQQYWAKVGDDFYNNWTRPGDRQRKMIDAARAGRPIVDENGIPLPEFWKDDKRE